MKNKDIKLNGSGYYDPTAYNAIKHVLKSEVKQLEAKTGEIWEVKQSNGDSCKVIVISAHDTFAQTLKLTESSGTYQVVCGGLMHTDPAKVTYNFASCFKQYIRTLKATEYADLMAEVSKCLGFESQKNEPIIAEAVKEPEQEFIPPVADDSHFDTAIQEELTKAKAERDVYKNLYENLISSMIAK